MARRDARARGAARARAPDPIPPDPFAEQPEAPKPDEDEGASPDDAASADPQATFAEYAAAYVEYLRVFRELEETHDQMVQPQKRESVRECLEATLGRALEMKRWLVYLNGGLEAVSLEDALLDLGLTPDALAVPVPRYYADANAAALATRDRAIRGALADAKAGKFRKPNQGEPEGDPSGDAAPTSGGDPAQAPGAPGPEDSGATGSAEGPPRGVRTSGPRFSTRTPRRRSVRI